MLWGGDREVEAYYTGIRRDWMDNILADLPGFDPAWAHPQAFVRVHKPAPQGMRYRIADLSNPEDVGPTIPFLNREEAGSLALSRLMTWVLRHGGPEARVPMDTGGWAELTIMARACHTRVELLVGIAKVAEKNRFQVAVLENPQEGRREAYSFIRCVQGHSLGFIDERRLMMRMTPLVRERLRAGEFFHATRYVHVESILKRGLLPGGLRSARRHVHMLPYFPEKPARFGKGLPREGRRRTDADAVIHMASANVMGEGRAVWITAAGAIVAWHKIPWSAFLRITVGYGREQRIIWDAAYADRAPVPYRGATVHGRGGAASGGAAGGAASGGAEDDADLRAMQTGAQYTLGRVRRSDPGDEPEEPGAPRYTQAAKRARWVPKVQGAAAGGAMGPGGAASGGACCFWRRGQRPGRSNRRHMFSEAE